MGCVCYINAHHFDKFTGKALCVVCVCVRLYVLCVYVLCVCAHMRMHVCMTVYAQTKIVQSYTVHKCISS